MKGKEPKRILATDCGSTTTKAILIEKRGDEYRLVVRGEAPTTVEAPFEDVTKGVLNSVMEVESDSFASLSQFPGLLWCGLVVAVNDLEAMLINEIGLDLARQLAFLLIQILGISPLTGEDQVALIVNVVFSFLTYDLVDDLPECLDKFL